MARQKKGKIMKDKFTKADLRDGMVVELGHGARYLVVGDRILRPDGYNPLSHYDDDLISKDCGVLHGFKKIFKVVDSCCYAIEDIFKGENLELIWERKEVKRMTAEEMRKKLEELTGERIEIIPNRWEMVEEIDCYCEDLDKCDDCMIKKECDSRGDFNCWSNEQLHECYEKVMEDGRKES